MSGRDARLRRTRTRKATLTQLATQFGISRTRVVQILDRTGGDPLGSARSAQLEAASVPELEAERLRLRDRIAADRRRLRTVEDELSARQTDRLLGLSV